MSALEHFLIVIQVIVLFFMYRHHKESERMYEDAVSARDAAIDISNHMMAIETTDEGFQYILEKCIEIFSPASLGSILVLDDEGYLTALAHHGFSETHIKTFRILFKESFIYQKTGGKLEKAVIINDLKAKLKPADIVETTEKGMYIQSQLTAPLLEGDKLIGIVCIDSLQNNAFTENDRMLLEYMMKHINRITLQQTLKESVVYHSRHDYLTHLFNRSYFDLKMEKYLEKTKETFVLCAIDLDGLKTTNDIHGHLAGDELIRRFAQGLLSIVDEREFAGRYGGDEFMVCFLEEDKGAVVKRLEQLNHFLEDHKFEVNGEDIVPKFSFGLVAFPEEGVLLDVLLSKADARMYEQKNQKKHRPTT